MKHFYDEIGGWFDYQALYAWAVWYSPAYAHFVEVGSWLGSSAVFMAVEIANSGKNIQFDCVDHWRGSSEHVNEGPVVNGTLYEDFLRNVEPVQEYLRPIRGESVEVAQDYEDGSLQFGFIDASHEEHFVAADLEAWWPKIRVGGWMAGHDFSNDGVGRAVMRFFKNKPVEWLRICDGSWCVRHTPGL